jgi:uncharacterized SAM-binding protein YcdF (DUF218 family)
LDAAAVSVTRDGIATQMANRCGTAVVVVAAAAKDVSTSAILRRRVMTHLIVAQFLPQSPIIVTGGHPQSGKTAAGQMRNILMLLGFPLNRITLEDKANATQNARFSVALTTSPSRGMRSVHSSTWASSVRRDAVD